MNNLIHSGGRIRGALLVAGAGFGLVAAPSRADEPRAKIAIVSSLATEGDHIRQRAFDGKTDTFFESTEPVKADDHFTLTFDEPATVQSVAVATGRPDGAAKLSGASVEVSDDGTTFDRVATVGPDGTARADLPGRKVKAIRIKATEERKDPLVIREFTIDSPRVQPFQHPVEFKVVCDDAPDLKPWTEETARLCEQWYDALTEQLATENYEPTDHVTMIMTRDYKGVAAAGNGRITGSVAYFEKHKQDQGAMIHETIHVIQRYRRRGNPGWLVEGVADYMRCFFFEPGHVRPVNPDTAKYDQSYQVTATFLDYVTRTYDRDLVKKLNKAMREGTYDKAIFERVTGKPIETLNDDWIASIRVGKAKKN